MLKSDLEILPRNTCCHWQPLQIQQTRHDQKYCPLTLTCPSLSIQRCCLMTPLLSQGRLIIFCCPCDNDSASPGKTSSSSSIDEHQYLLYNSIFQHQHDKGLRELEMRGCWQEEVQQGSSIQLTVSSSLSLLETLKIFYQGRLGPRL